MRPQCGRSLPAFWRKGPGTHSLRANSAATDIAAAVDHRYCELMKNVTVSLDDETWHKARIKALR